jgi:RecB family exonuclease
MRDLDCARVPFSQAAALAWFTSALSETEIPVGSEDGIQVLDAMQARGLSFDTVFLIGFNADLVPRRPREDPFLRDDVRRLLRTALGSHVEIKLDGLLEEHLLLAQIAGAAERSLVVTWLRADTSGKARVPSLALREVVRLTAGGAHVKDTIEAAIRLPAHPLEAARDAAGRLGVLSPGEAMMASILQLGSPRGVIESRDLLPPASSAADGWEALSAGLNALATIEGFSPADLSRDGFVGDAIPAPEAWSPSRLETLGSCPQLYFFRHALRAEEMEDPGEEHSIEAKEIGSRVHRILHDIYRSLIDSGDLSSPTSDPSRAARRAADLVEEIWARHTFDLAERIHPRHPLLWEMISTQWRNALHTFVLHDVASLVRVGSRIIGLEHRAEARIPLGAREAALNARGVFDRVLRGDGGTLVVSDYKSGGSLQKHVEMKDALKGARLQLALYTLIASGRASSWGLENPGIRAEVLGVGPEYQGEEVEKTRLGLDPEKLAAGKEGLLETIGVLASLAESGIYPLNERSGRCAFCSFSRACRKSHPPTLARLAGAAGAKDYYLVRRKNTKDPTLASVRRRTDDEEEEVEEA